MDAADHAEEAPCCRVCHGESEPDNQLFFPCKCDGSIKYVHQACLEQWLKVAGKSNPKCELCGEPFHFQKVYKSDTPYRITIYDVFLELIPRAWQLGWYSLTVVFASFVWVVLLPVFTNWWLKSCWCFISDPQNTCFTTVPSFIENQSTEGFVTYWYFGLVDVCIIIAASVISFEIGHVVYKEYKAATNKQKMRQLEQRLANNRIRAQNLQEESLKKERCLFAVSDYESLKYEWDVSKKTFESSIGPQHRTKPTTPAGDASQEELPVPSVAERFMMVHSLANDERFCRRIVDKLDTVCEATEQSPGFVGLRATFVKLHVDLEKTNAECAKLIGLLPSAYSEFHQQVRPQGSPLSPLGPAGDASPDSADNFNEDIPWYEQDTGIDVDALEPTMDNLELRANLLMRRRLREEAQRERQAVGGAAATAQAPLSHATPITARMYGDGADDDDSSDAEAHGEEEQIAEVVEEGGGASFDYAAEWRKLHEGEEEQVKHENGEVEQRDSVNKEHNQAEDPSSEATPLHTANSGNSGEDEAMRHPTERRSEPTQDQAEHLEGYYYEDMCADEGEGEGESDDPAVEVAGVLENIVSYIEFAECDIELEMEEEIDDDEYGDYGEGEGREGGAGEGDYNHAGGVDGEDRTAAVIMLEQDDLEPVLDPAAAVEPPADAGADADAPAPQGIVEVQVVNPPGLAMGGQQLRFNEPFLHVQHMALAYAYVMLFIAAALLLPAFLGDCFFSFTPLGQMFTARLGQRIAEHLRSEENFLVIMKLLDHLEYPTEGLEVHADNALVARILLTQARAVLNLAFGYALYAAVPLAGLAFCYLQYVANIDYSGNAFDVVGVVTRQARALQGVMHTGAKMAILLVVNGIALPLAITYLTAKFVNKGLPVYLRAPDLASFPVLLIFGLFIFSHLFISHVRHVCYELRQVINKKYLVGILPETTILEAGAQDQVLNVHDRVSKSTYSDILKTTIIRTSILLPAFVFGVVLPVRLGHWCVPFARPLLFRLQQVTVEVQIPVEMMLSHIFIPLIVDKLRYKSIAKQVVTGFVTYLANLLNIMWILEPPAPAAVPGDAPAPVLAGAQMPRPAPLPAQHVALPQLVPEHPDAALVPQQEAGGVLQGIEEVIEPAPVAPLAGAGVVPTAAPAVEPVGEQTRVGPMPVVEFFVLGASGLLLFGVLSSYLLHAPLTVGRWVMGLTGLPTHNDLFNYPVGLLLCWGAGFIVQYIARDIYRNAGAANALRSTAKWLSLTVQMLGVGLLWLAVPPLILGVLLEALFVVPLRVSLMETSYFPFLQNWAFGLIILKAFCKLLLSGLFGELELRNQMEMVVIRGFAQFDAAASLQRVVCPVLLHLLDLLLVPYFFARCLCLVTPSYYVRTLMLRYCFHVYIATLGLGHVGYHVIVAIVKLHNEVRDSKYLIGTKLTNRV